MFEANAVPQTTEVVTSWFVNTKLDLGTVHYSPSENIALSSDKTEGAWDTLRHRAESTHC